MLRKLTVAFASFAVLALLALGGYQIYVGLNGKNPGPNAGSTEVLHEITINEAVRTLLYLPLYHAQRANHFEKHGLKVNIVTAGSATNSFASMLSGESDFSQADPMYVPISREKGSDAIVVAQVLGKISLWAVTLDPDIETLNPQNLVGKTISTHPRPMTAYTYTKNLLDEFGLGDTETSILQSKPGTEVVPLLNGQSQVAVTIEPATSVAVTQGAHVVFSFPQHIGDRVFTALMARRSYLDQNPGLAAQVFSAYDDALKDMHQHPDAALATAQAYFPQLDEAVLKMALDRLLSEKVFPDTAAITPASWDGAVDARIAVGDLAKKASFEDNVLRSR